jgi:3-hydroxybutyryl-CoA dehydrogenase
MKLDSIGVIGAGTSGKGMIRALAGSNLNVTFCEVSEEKVEQAIHDIEDSLEREKARWSVTEGEKRLILSRINGTTDIRKMAGMQMVLEATPGEVEDKQELYQELDQVFPEDTLLVSTSATICVSDIAKKTLHPERVIGLHFCLPVPRRPIIEIMRGRETSDKTFETAKLLARIMKKEILDVFEMPGLITTRIMIPYINEAMHIVMEGLASPDEVDKAIRLGFKLPIGPLTMADEMGLDTLLHAMERLFDSLGELQYRPCPLLRRLVRQNYLGQKTRRGFFVYDEEGRQMGLPERRTGRDPNNKKRVTTSDNA